MFETQIVERKGMGKLKKPVLIVGLPGIGLVGQVVARYMIRKMKGKKIAELYSPHFPHQVLMTRKGRIRPLRNSFFEVKSKGKDFIVLVGDVQAVTSTGQYEVAEKVLDYAERKKVGLIVTIGGYSTGKMDEEKQVFGAANGESAKGKFEKAGILFGKTKGSIVGAAGLIPVLAKLRGIDAVCVMGETHGSYVDPASASQVMQKLMKVLGFKVDLSELESEATEREKVIKKIENEIEKQVSKKKDITYIR